MSTIHSSAAQQRPGMARLFSLGLPVIAAALLSLPAAPVHAQSYVNITVGGAVAPGVYGQISMGSHNPPPPVVNVQPVIAGPVVYGAPVAYVYAPPEHVRDWGRHCGYYRACGRPVHFVEMHRGNPWWNHHNEHLRGRERYWQPEHGRGDHDRHGRHD